MPKMPFRKTKVILAVVFGSLFLNFSLAAEGKYPAMWQEKVFDKAVRCNLCPYRCILREGQVGQCGVRKNIGGKLYSLNYGKVVAFNIDPVEKKPLFHFLPGSYALSLASAGCNLHCKFCQNWEISQRTADEVPFQKLAPEDIVAFAKKHGCSSIAYTYSEPVVFYELMYNTAKLAKKEGVHNIMVTAGFINPEPLKELLKYMDAVKVDLKGFSKDFYKNVVFGDRDVILNNLKIIKQSGVWLEIVNLVIPTLNDSSVEIKEMCQWIKDNLGTDVPLHFSRFYPMYKMKNLPPTPVETLEKAREIALSVGLKYVYIGNVPGHPAESTYCPKCGRLLIKRQGYKILENNVIEGRCKFCREEIPGVFGQEKK